MPYGPGTYGNKVGRPPKKKSSRRNGKVVAKKTTRPKNKKPTRYA